MKQNTFTLQLFSSLFLIVFVFYVAIQGGVKVSSLYFLKKEMLQHMFLTKLYETFGNINGSRRGRRRYWREGIKNNKYIFLWFVYNNFKTHRTWVYHVQIFKNSKDKFSRCPNNIWRPNQLSHVIQIIPLFVFD